jgi:hypothetical protein
MEEAMRSLWRRRQGTSAGQFDALAEVISERIAAAAEDLSSDPEKIYDAVVEKLTEEGVSTRLAEIFEEMDTVAQWELIVKYFGDKKVEEVLEAHCDGGRSGAVQRCTDRRCAPR